MLLPELAERAGGIHWTGRSVRITGIAYDSRQVQEGFLFVAIRGEKTHGLRFVRQAIERGAAALAAEEEIHPPPEIPVLHVPDARKFLAQASHALFQDPSSKLDLVAITGTNGKTTTSFLVDAIYRKANLRSCVLGTIGMKIEDRPFPAVHTTPEAPDLLHFLDAALQAGCTHGVLEVSSHALALKRVFGAKFKVAVFTNLTPEHLDFHNDMESYYRAKRLLFVAEGENRIDSAAINIDDPYGRRLASEIPCPVTTYGFDTGADFHPVDVRYRTDGTDLQISTPGGMLPIRSHLVGRPNVFNVMAAAAAAANLKLMPEAIRDGLESLSGVAGRMEVVRAGQPFTVIVDYAHTPDALEKLLQTVRRLTNGKVITVFGCGGDRDRKKRPLMGEIAARLSDRVVATSDNPRTEDPHSIIAEIQPGLRNGPAQCTTVPDRREAIRVALSGAAAQDVVVIAGKGHENYQIVGTQTFLFDDRTVARELILELFPGPRSAELT